MEKPGNSAWNPENRKASPKQWPGMPFLFGKNRCGHGTLSEPAVAEHAFLFPGSAAVFAPPGSVAAGAFHVGSGSDSVARDVEVTQAAANAADSGSAAELAFFVSFAVADGSQRD